MKNIFGFLSLILLFAACSDASEDNEQTIIDYLNTNNLTAQRTSEGLYYIIDNPGTSEMPNINSTVNVDYVGTLLDGFQFDANNGSEFGLWQVIEGWQIGIPLFGKGGSGTLYIPSSLGYGSNGSGSIPGNAVLIFEITLNDFQ